MFAIALFTKTLFPRRTISRTALACAALLPLSALALDPQSLLFEQHFESLTEIQSAGGSCKLAGVDCPSTVFVAGATGNAVEIKKTGFPLVSFPVTYNGDTRIDPQKGTLVFNYVPLGSGAGGDWGSTPPVSKTMFFLSDPSQPISQYQTLKVGTYYDSVSGKQYLYFRHDATSGCVGAGAPYTLSCQRETNTAQNEPGVVMEWLPNVEHKIMVTWDLTATRPYLALFIDGVFSKVGYQSALVGLGGFAPTTFYIGSLVGMQPAQGRIDNVAIYGDVALDPANPVPAYIEQTLNDGVWQPHETVNNSTDAPAALNISGQPFIFYQSYDFEPIYEGNVPASAVDPAEIVIDVARNQHQTAFFNIYAGVADLTSVATSVSNLTSGANVIDQTKIKIRTVKNWWQAGKQVMKEIIPAYSPELLLYDDTQNPQCTGLDANLKPTCTGGLFPSDPASTSTTTTVKTQTSRQFAVTLDIPSGTAPGTYAGTITTTTNLGYKTVPIKVVVHGFSLPVIDKTVALYNHNRFDAATSNSNYVTQSIYQQQLQNMREHGVNGLLYYGQTASYPTYATAAGLTGFGGYIYPGDSQLTTAVGLLNTAGLTPYIYGIDEPSNIKSTLGRNQIPEQLKTAKLIHAAGGKVTTAISKQWADTLNNSSLFPYTDDLGQTYTFAQGKLDLANLAVELLDSTTQNYFSGLLNGTVTKAANPEVYYWQMDREDPRINRFYTGYHLWLTDLTGVFPYVFQKLINDPFNDFDQASGDERDLNVIYPSLEGGIDTIEWEAFRAGIDDYRMLQLWRTLHVAIALQPNNNAAARQVTLDALLTKYRSIQAFKTVTRAQFAADRGTLIAQLDGMTADLVDSDADGVGAGFDNCVPVSNPTQADINNNGIGDACEHGLTGRYYDGTTLDGSVILSRIDSAVDFNWGFASPASGVNTDYFSVRWTGRLVVPAYTGTYEFCIKGDDGIRLWVNSTEVLDFWVPQDSVKNCADISLTAGQSVPIKVEFFDATEEAIVQMTWSYPGQAEQVVPTSSLYAQ